LPTRLQAAGGRPGREQLVRSVHCYADAFSNGMGDLRQLRLPDGRDRRTAQAFVEAMTRVAAATGRLRFAIDRYRPADPTDMRAVSRSFQGLDVVGAQIGRLSKVADATAAGYGFRRCGHLQPRQVRRVAPPRPTVSPPPGLTVAGRHRFIRGRRIAAQAGCLACHRVGAGGHDRPASDLGGVGARLSTRQIKRALLQPRASMPSYRSLPRAARDDLVAFLRALRAR